MIIYYNPECSKCREAKDLLQSNSCEVEIRNYLAEPPSEQEIRKLIALLGCKAEDLVRKNEKEFEELSAQKTSNEQDYIDVLISNPALLQRPIIIDGKRAIIGRPPILVLDLLR